MFSQTEGNGDSLKERSRRNYFKRLSKTFHKQNKKQKNNSDLLYYLYIYIYSLYYICDRWERKQCQ